MSTKIVEDYVHKYGTRMVAIGGSKANTSVRRFCKDMRACLQDMVEELKTLRESLPKEPDPLEELSEQLAQLKPIE